MRAKAKLYPKEAARLIREKPGVREAVTGATLHFERNRLKAYAEVPIEAWRECSRLALGKKALPIWTSEAVEIDCPDLVFQLRH